MIHGDFLFFLGGNSIGETPHGIQRQAATRRASPPATPPRPATAAAAAAPAASRPPRAMARGRVVDASRRSRGDDVGSWLICDGW